MGKSELMPMFNNGFRPLRDLVLVKKLETESKIGSLHVPDAAKEKPQRGEVIAVGKGTLTKKGELIPIDVKPGDTILFGKYSGEDIKLDNEEYVTMHEGEILAVLGTTTTSIDTTGATVQT